MVFGIFSPKLKELISERFQKPTEVQFKGIPPIHSGKNTLVIASTGTGKTETVLLPLFDRWVSEEHKPISILYITPLRSLNRDLEKRISWWSEHLSMDASVRHGDTTQYERSMQAANPPDLMISTPETLQAMLTGKVMRKHLSNIRVVVIDEIHELVDSKRGIQLSLGLQRLKSLIASAGNVEPQFVGLSATVGTPKKVAEYLTGEECTIVDATEAKKIDIKVESPKSASSDNDISGKMLVSPEITARLRTIIDFIKKKKSTLIFTNTREFAEILSSRLNTLEPDLAVDTHHSSLSREVRIDAETRLKEGKLRALVCTSSLELGIDIGDIDLTLQYMSPRQVSKLLQRIGRSGHSVGSTSYGYILSSDPDDCFESAVVADLGIKGKIESSDVYRMALDVLAHQIVGMSMEEYKIPAKKAYETVKAAMPYSGISFEEFMEVCMFLQRLRLVWVDDRFSEEVVIKRRKGAFEYYYRNLSTIPDVKNYRIVDIVSNRPVGSLDAEFIAMHGSPGTSFIVKGQAWKVLDVRKNTVMVEPQSGIEASIPAWEGELIPVPFDVARGVGRMRREIKAKLSRGKGAAVKHLVSRYPLGKEAALKMANYVKRQMKSNSVPDDRDIVIEYSSSEDSYWVVIHTCFGSMVNETLGRVLTDLISSRLGSVGLQTDPYRIMLRLQSPRWKDVADTFRYMEPDSIEKILDISLPKTQLFNWKFVQVAQRMGIIDRDADYGKAYITKVVDAYMGTPVYREVMNEIKTEKLDIEKSKLLMREIAEGKRKIYIEQGSSPFAQSGLVRKYEIVRPDRPEKEIFDVFRKRIMDTKLRLLCSNCGDWASNVKVSEEPELRCPRCGALSIGVIPHWDLETQKAVKKKLEGKRVKSEEKKQIERLANTATMVMNYGQPALKALAGRGVGWTTAKRILAESRNDEELFRKILDAERNYAKTKRFWKV